MNRYGLRTPAQLDGFAVLGQTVEEFGQIIGETVFAGSGTQTAGGSAGSLAIPVGGQLTIQGYNVTNPSGVVGQIWGNTTSGTASTIAGLASIPSVV